MSALVESFFYCLLASMVWAPIVFLTASRFRKSDAPDLADKIWPAALVIAALPAIVAPFAAVFGLSLRTMPPLPPMGALAPAPEIVANGAPIVMAPATTITLATMLEAAAVLYFYGFLMFLVLGIARHIWFAYRIGYAFDLDEPKLESALEEWRHRMGLMRRPRYAFSDVVSSVCVHGIFRPVVLMPFNLLDRVSMDDAVLMGAHEMAHIKRGDTALFALCTVVKAVFWFNPFMQRIAARATLAAEQAADALVIARGVDRRHYAHCFVRGLRFAAGANHAGRELVPSFTPFDKRSRRERLDAILSGTGGARLLSLRHKIWLALSIILAAALAFAQAALAVAPRPAKDALPQSPVDGIVTMTFQEKNLALGDDRPNHEGVDIKAKRGTVVRAAGDGKVIDATKRYRSEPAWGKVVVIDHGHGLITRYAHLDSYVVRKGDQVSAGDVIGAVGSTGRSSGPHLHFEVIQDGLPIDPAPVIAAAPMPAPKPVDAPAVEPAIKSARAQKVMPAPKPTFSERIEETLDGRFDKLELRVAEAFKDFEPLENFKGFEGFTIELDDFDLESFADMQALAVDALDGVSSMAFLSEEDREKIREAQREALRDASEAMREAKRDRERAQRDRERARRDAERAEEQAQRDKEQMKRDMERAERDRERARRDIERAREQAERDRAHAEEYASTSREEMLALREAALKEARADLEKELAEIERLRAELEREKRANKNN